MKNNLLLSDEKHPSAALRVLIVEDNPYSSWTLERLLQLFGCDVSVARDGVTALEQITAGKPDVVLLDIGIPEMDGWEVSRRVRQQEQGKQPVLIAVTGYSSAEDRERSQQSGINLHLVKPIDVRELRELLAHYTSIS